MRGAYEVGVVSGIIAALRRKPSDEPAFRVFAGTSVGAINAACLASRAHRGDHDIHSIVDVWRGLRLEEHLHLRPTGLLPLPGKLGALVASIFGEQSLRRSLLNSKGLDRVVRTAVDWTSLHHNVSHGVVHALIVAALDVGSGCTTMFAELSPEAEYSPSPDFRRQSVRGPLAPEHVLASASIPLLFPTRRIGNRHYCDGGLRFNTPIAPAIRAGADQLVVVPLLFNRHHEPGQPGSEQVSGTVDPSPLFLLGKLLDALLLDPVDYDLVVLERFNRLARALHEALDPRALARIEHTLIESRGQTYREIPTLVFKPSQDIGLIAAEALREVDFGKLGGLGRYLLEKLSTDAMLDADWASFLLFDGGFASRLMDLGCEDALKRRDEIREFFGHSREDARRVSMAPPAPS